MGKYFSNFFASHKIVVATSILLALLPFFWLKPFEMDLGGDASRLYFFDPVAYLNNLNLYLVSPQGVGPIITYQFSTPFLLLLILLKKVFVSSYFIVVLFKSVQLSLSFYIFYLLVEELIKNNTEKLSKTALHLSAFITGLLYVLNPISQYGGWQRELFDHTQILINPLIFFLMLRYVHTRRQIYIVVALLVSFVFSVNFSLSSAPKFFAFYPISLVYLAMYAIWVKGKKINLIHYIFPVVLFFLIHAFHLLPLLATFFEKGTLTSTKVFAESSVTDALNFFRSMAAVITSHRNLMFIEPTLNSFFDMFYFIFPAIILGGLAFNKVGKKKYKTSPMLLVMTAAFFLFVFYFVTAKITDIGAAFYQVLFHIPGFSMFRNFFGQWAHTFVFYYALLLGFCIYILMSYVDRGMKYVVTIIVVGVIVVRAAPFINGEIINQPITKSAGIDVKGTIEFDKEYLELLSFVQELPPEGKFLTLPLTDHFYQIVAGKGTGVYFGPSTISYLTGKNDFSGFQILTPYSELFEKYVKAKDYVSLKKLLGLLNIKYIVYNSDKRVLHYFLDFPYQHSRQYLPTTQDGYKIFIEQLGVRHVKSFGENYHIYELDNASYHPQVYTSVTPQYADIEINEGGYVATDFLSSDEAQSMPLLFLKNNNKSLALDDEFEVPQIEYNKINPTKYEVTVSDARNPYFLVLLNAFNENWRLYRYTDNKKSLLSAPQLLANGYANGWYISNQDLTGTDYTLAIELATQKYVHWGNVMSLVGLLILLGWSVILHPAVRSFMKSRYINFSEWLH